MVNIIKLGKSLTEGGDYSKNIVADVITNVITKKPKMSWVLRYKYKLLRLKIK